jgi:hypothetical protein
MTSNDDCPKPPRRGDLIIVGQYHRDAMLHGSPREYHTYTVGTVTSVSREGRVRMFSEAGSVGEPELRGRHHRGTEVTGHTQTFVLSSDQIDAPGALATAACRTWDVGNVRHAATRPYETLAQAVDALSPHRKTETGWMALNQAAAEHAAARRAAWVSCSRGQASHGVYEAQLLAANDKYLAVYAEVTGQAVTGTDRPGTLAATGRQAIATPAGHSAGKMGPAEGPSWAGAGPAAPTAAPVLAQIGGLAKRGGCHAVSDGYDTALPAGAGLWQLGGEPAGAEMEL